MISLDNVKFEYKANTNFANPAVKGLSGSINNGAVVGVTGHTGSGKSTLVQMIAGLIYPTNGEIKVNNLVFNNASKVKAGELCKNISYVFQDASTQIFEENVEKEIGFACKNLGFDAESIREKVLAIIKRVELSEDFLPKNPLNLSGGEKRRVTLASSLITNAPIVIMDEPLIGLDRSGRENIFKLINELKSEGKTIICVSHDMNFVAENCDYIWVMKEGNLILNTTVEKGFQEREILKEAGIIPPVVSQLIYHLNKKGYNIPTNIYKEKDFLDFMKNRINNELEDNANE